MFGNQSNLTTIPNKNGFLSDHKYAIAGSLFGGVGTIIGAGVDALKSHDIDNIKSSNIYI